MRIISLAPSFTEIIEGLGAGRDLFAASDYCEAPGREFLRMGPPQALRVEEIEKLAPDLILADKAANRPEQVARLAKHFAVFSQDVTSVHDVLKTISALGALTGRSQEAFRLTSELSLIQALHSQKLRPVRTVVLLWEQPLLTVNRHTYISSLVETAGGMNLFGDDPVPEFAVELEDVMEKSPELLLLAGEPFAFGKVQAQRYSGFRDFAKTAIRIVDGKDLSWFGPRTAGALARLATVIKAAR